MKKVVDLIKADKLTVVVGRSGYQIPDSIDLREAFGQLAFRHSDFTYDSTYSILFHLDIHKELVHNPVIVYTDNEKRIKEYESRGVTKIINNWYFTYE